MRIVTLALAALVAAGPAGAVPGPPPSSVAGRAAAPACPLWYAPGEPPAFYPHPDPSASPVEAVASLTDASGWAVLSEVRGWIEVGRPSEALAAVERAPEGPAARLYRMAALEALGRWTDLEAALADVPPAALPSGCGPLRDLWHARAASAADRGTEADLAFERLGAALPALGAWVELLRLEAAVLGGDVARGEEAWSRIHVSSLPALASVEARRLLPDLYERGGRLEDALAWRETLAGETRGTARARHWLEAARLADRLGRIARGDELRRRAIVHESAYAGSLLLEPELRAQLGIGTFEAARILIDAGRPAEAEPLVSAVLAADGPVDEQQRATLLRAQARGATGDREGAERDYAAFLARWPSDARAPEAALDRARLALRARDGRVARQRLEEFLARWPGHARTHQATFLLADSYHDDWNAEAGMAERAIELFDRVVAQHPGSYFADRARMRAAHLAFALGRFAEAERRYRAYRGADARESRYWTARALERQGRHEEASAIWRELAAGGDEYYALLSRERLRGRAGLAVLLPSGYRAAPEPAYVAGGDLALASPGGQTATALLALGRRSWAQAELERALADAGADRATRLAWAATLEAWGFPDLALRVGAGLGERGSDSERYAFPAGFWAAIDRESREHGLDGAYVMALIRQESLFRSRAVSPVGARGLMQIMPETGREIAEGDGWPGYDEDILFDPVVSLHFGSLYLAWQRDRFDGFWPAVLAAYNGGPHNVAVWMEFHERGIDPELWVDRIPFKETREYVRKIVAQEATYRRLYGHGASGQ